MAGWQDWVGREEVAEDVLTPETLRRFTATLEGVVPLPAHPLCLHWCLAAPALPASALGQDGHPAKGGFLPPIPLPRRMWAGGEITFHAPLPLGTAITRTSRIAAIREKQGRTGPLVFVEVAHEFSAGNTMLVSEVQTLVYRTPAPLHRPQAEGMGTPTVSLTPDATLLFRYSALTFNGHRIHYDEPYARTVEGYPGLVVHGPLVATLLANLAEAQAGRSLRHLTYRGASPAIADETLHLFTDAGQLEARSANGALVSTATASFDI
ncbi:FAS1-like dehydratase domain-containing protein [Algicella marina]|uniref:FAS1-like dehydratase domain-containing protein n=1 Tax=Algicella marina TaxID=2683284 RepID=A0A6P1STW6_9RHOB|nr:MaoC family dehydratase N-terminal domain-containing protein [Algicella marina]QHQ34134.1 hypothetical protein GO499_02500 [Algicella marina]